MRWTGVVGEGWRWLLRAIQVIPNMRTNPYKSRTYFQIVLSPQETEEQLRQVDCSELKRREDQTGSRLVRDRIIGFSNVLGSAGFRRVGWGNDGVLLTCPTICDSCFVCYCPTLPCPLKTVLSVVPPTKTHTFFPVGSERPPSLLSAYRPSRSFLFAAFSASTGCDLDQPELASGNASTPRCPPARVRSSPW